MSAAHVTITPTDPTGPDEQIEQVEQRDLAAHDTALGPGTAALSVQRPRRRRTDCVRSRPGLVIRVS